MEVVGLKAWRAFTFISFALGIAYLALQYFHTRQNGRYQQVHDLNRFGSNVNKRCFRHTKRYNIRVYTEA